jgi:tripartite-type tricarboxylate transporter receptor subunit TctC
MVTLKLNRRHFISAIATTPVLALAADPVFPTRQITIVVAYAPGGSTDIVARMLAKEMATGLKQPVIVDNRAGGGTAVGTQAVKRANADGYTLLFGTNAFVISSLIQKPTPWDPVKDFEPVGMVTLQALGLFVRPALKISSVPELIAYAKANPGKLNFASSGNGSAQHLAGEAFAATAGISMLHVPYKGAGPAIQDLIGGQVDLMFTSMVGLSSFIKEKRVALIATTGKTRSTTTPEVPTMAESGVPGFNVQSWQALFAPPMTPPEVLNKLNAELVRVAKAGVLSEYMKDQGLDLAIGSPAELRAHILQERETYGRLLKTLTIQ